MIGSTRYVAGREIGRQNQLSAEIAKLQTSISSDKRLEAPSDDAPASARISEIRQSQADRLIWTRNVATGTAVAAAADTALGSVTNLLQRAKELVLAGSNQTNNATDRATYALELRGLADDIDTLSQSKDPDGNPLFPAVEPLSIPVGEAETVPATASRDAVFGSVPALAGTKSIARVLREAADALTADDISPAVDIAGNPVLDANGDPVTVTRGERITSSIADVDAALVQHGRIVTEQGIRGQRFEVAKARLSSGDADLKVERSGLEDTDLTYALSAFQAKQLSLQAAQTVFAQANRKSLFDLLG